MRIPVKFLIVTVVLTTTLTTLLFRVAYGNRDYSFQPPQTITVTMYHLTPNGALITPNKLCGAQAVEYGCTIDSGVFKMSWRDGDSRID